MVPIGTNALLAYVANISRNMQPPAASADPAIRPQAAQSQEMAATNSTSRPATASQAASPACGRNPMPNATANTRTVETTLRATFAAT